MKNIENIRLNGETYSLAPGFYDEPTYATTKIGNININNDLTNLSVKEVVKKMVAPSCVFPEFEIVNTDPYIFIGSASNTETKTIVFCDEYENALEELKAEIETWSLCVTQGNTIKYSQEGTGDNFDKNIISQLWSIEGLITDRVTVTFEITTKAITDINDVRYNEGKTSKTFKKSINLTAINGIAWYCTDSDNDPFTLDEIAQKYTNHKWEQELLYGNGQNFALDFSGIKNSYLYFVIPGSEIFRQLTLIDCAGHNVLSDDNLLGKFEYKETIYVYCVGNQMLTCDNFILKGIY